MKIATSVLALVLAACSSGESSPGGGGASSNASAGNTSAGNTSAGNTSAGNASAGQSQNTQGGSSNSPGGSSSNASAGTGSAVQTGPVTCRSKGDGKSTISFINKCQGTLSFRGTDIEGGDLASGEHACRDVGDTTKEIPAIRFWGFIGMDPGGEKHTLAELTLNTSFNDFDWYNISHVDASNLPMQVVPVDMASCRTLTCAESLLANCPEVGLLKDASGKVISCVSPDRDNPDSVVAQYFEASCKDAYSWSGDDSESVAACAGEDYDVVFCP